MITIRNYTLMTKISGKNVRDANTARVEFDVDTIEELPSEGVLEGYTLYQGSIAYVINSGKFYVLNSEGEWRDAKNGSAFTGE